MEILVLYAMQVKWLIFPKSKRFNEFNLVCIQNERVYHYISFPIVSCLVFKSLPQIIPRNL